MIVPPPIEKGIIDYDVGSELWKRALLDLSKALTVYPEDDLQQLARGEFHRCSVIQENAPMQSLVTSRDALYLRWLAVEALGRLKQNISETTASEIIGEFLEGDRIGGSHIVAAVGARANIPAEHLQWASEAFDYAETGAAARSKGLLALKKLCKVESEFATTVLRVAANAPDRNTRKWTGVEDYFNVVALAYVRIGKWRRQNWRKEKALSILMCFETRTVGHLRMALATQKGGGNSGGKSVGPMTALDGRHWA